MTDRDTDSTAQRAYDECDRVAQECVAATGMGEYAEGYRAAGERMREEIARLRSGRARTPLEQELRDAEVEARTLARVVDAAQRAVAALDLVDGMAADSLRSVVTEFFDADDLPLGLRAPAEAASRTRLMIDAPSSPALSRRKPPR